jgi:hypothetical protein
MDWENETKTDDGLQSTTLGPLIQDTRDAL